MSLKVHTTVTRWTKDKLKYSVLHQTMEAIDGNTSQNF